MHHIPYDHQIFLAWLSCEKHTILNSSNGFGLFVSSYFEALLIGHVLLLFFFHLSFHRFFSCSPVCHLLMSPCLFKPVFISYSMLFRLFCSRHWVAPVVILGFLHSCLFSPRPFVLPVFCMCYPWIYGLFLLYCVVVWIVFVASFLLPAFFGNYILDFG